MIPFTYLLKHIPTNKYYYGVKLKKGCHPNDLWTKYFTSSKKVKGLIRKYGKKSFLFEIRKTFKTQKQAREWEHKVLRRMKVIYRDDFLNQSDSRTIDPRIIRLFKLGKPRSEETKQKLRLANLGKKHTLKTRKKMKSSHTGMKHSKQTKQKMSLSQIGEKNHMYGKKLTKKHRMKISKSGIKAWEKRRAA